MKTIPWWSCCVILGLTSCGGGNLQHMDATPYVDLIQRPNGECPQSKQEQGIMNKHPDATIIATVSEITGANVMTTAQIPVKGNQTVYIGCTILPSGQSADRKILNVQFE
ncbi:MAG TPA: hypothetical protein PKK23_08430 [Nitrospirales bacterium]|nr:hypothetical protein [Nitrospiraceae bacterium]HNP29055.1 hypothetical protein [Nitrospirales bacterium]